MAAELLQTLQTIHSGKLREFPIYRQVPNELLELRHVALHGDTEPTLSPQFVEAVQAVVHVRALGQFPFFKIVLATDGSRLDVPEVRYALKFFICQDEIWIQLNPGPQAPLDTTATAQPLEKILANIVTLGRQRPIIIDSPFQLSTEKDCGDRTSPNMCSGSKS